MRWGNQRERRAGKPGRALASDCRHLTVKATAEGWVPQAGRDAVGPHSPCDSVMHGVSTGWVPHAPCFIKPLLGPRGGGDHCKTLQNIRQERGSRDTLPGLSTWGQLTWGQLVSGHVCPSSLCAWPAADGGHNQQWDKAWPCSLTFRVWLIWWHVTDTPSNWCLLPAFGQILEPTVTPCARPEHGTVQLARGTGRGQQVSALRGVEGLIP